MKNDPERDDDRWDEFKWEEFLKESDTRTDRLVKIIEEHSEDPDLESMLAREMGFEKYGKESQDDPSTIDEDEDNGGESWKNETGSGSLPGKVSLDPADEHPANKDNLYQKAYAFAVATVEWFRELPEEVRNNIDVIEVVTRASIPAAKVVSAWDDDERDQAVFGFRIAVYKRGLIEANKALASMNRILQRNIVDRDRLLRLIRQATEVRNGIAVRILEIRELYDRGM